MFGFWPIQTPERKNRIGSRIIEVPEDLAGRLYAERRCES
jgi:hypothetical protein